MDDLTLARQIIADQQMALARLKQQLLSSFAINPDGNIVHIACGTPIVSSDIDGQIEPGCDCFHS